MNHDKSIDNIYKLDGKVPVGKAIPFGLQHILAMFVANIAPILIVAGACGLSAAQTTNLVQCAMMIAYYCAYFIVCTGMVCGEDKPEIKEQKLRYSVAFFGVFRTLLFGLFQGAGINSGSFAKCFDLWK